MLHSWKAYFDVWSVVQALFFGVLGYYIIIFFFKTKEFEFQDILFPTLIGICVYITSWNKHKKEIEKKNKINLPAGCPPLQHLKVIHGEGISMNEENWIVIMLWATWCGQSKKAFFPFNTMSKHFANKGVKFIAVTNENEICVKEFLIKLGRTIQFAVAIDDDSLFARLNKIEQKRIPSTYIISNSRKIVWHGHPNQLQSALELYIDTDPTIKDNHHYHYHHHQ